MLTEILTRESCAKCRVCCVFDRDDCWEMPLIKPELAERLAKEYPEVQLRQTGRCSVFTPRFDSKGLCTCPMLTEKGCALGDEKPFDCRIWPFRVMRRGDLLLLTLSPVCETVSNRTVSEISRFAEKFSSAVFKEAEENPEMIKNYVEGYPIFAVREL